MTTDRFNSGGPVLWDTTTNVTPRVGELFRKQSGEAWVYVGRGRFERAPAFDIDSEETP